MCINAFGTEQSVHNIVDGHFVRGVRMAGFHCMLCNNITPALTLYSTCCQQMQSLSVEPILVLVLALSTWTMLAALAVRLT